MTTALYLYAVVSVDARLDGILGVDQERVEVIAAESLGAVVGEVRVEALAGISDPAAVGSLAQRHDGVVRAAMVATNATLPFRLGTLLRDRDALRSYMVTRRAELLAGLDHVASCREWGVTIREDGAKPAAPVASTSGESGTAYLLRRRAELAKHEERRRMRALARAEVGAELRTHAVATRVGRRDGTELLLDESYLVRSDSEDAFFAAVDRCGDRMQGLELVLQASGPWPPYSFAPVVDEGERG